MENPIEEIMSEALENSYDLVAVGGGGGQMGLLHQKLGSTTSKLARKLHTHFLVARNVPKKVEKVLILYWFRSTWKFDNETRW